MSDDSTSDAADPPSGARKVSPPSGVRRPRQVQQVQRGQQAGAARPRGLAAPFAGPAGPILDGLFQEKGLAPATWWPFLVQGEGKVLPGGVEALSGFVLASDGTVYGWWLGWRDGAATGARGTGATAAPGVYVLERWWPVAAPEQKFAGDAEYRAARRRLGLSALPAAGAPSGSSRARRGNRAG